MVAPASSLANPIQAEDGEPTTAMTVTVHPTSLTSN